MNIKRSPRKGFTLIELLVVIVIIGVLAVAFLPTAFDAPRKARDATRVANLAQSINAIELFYNENGNLPGTTGCFFNGVAGQNDAGDTINGTMNPDFADDYLRGEYPLDPLGGDAGLTECPNGAYYFYADEDDADGEACYALIALLEVDDTGNYNGQAPTDFKCADMDTLAVADGNSLYVRAVNL